MVHCVKVLVMQMWVHEFKSPNLMWSQFSYREILVQIEAPGTSKSGKGSSYSNNNKQTNHIFGKSEHIDIVSSDTHTYNRIHTNHANFTDLTGVNPNITYTPIKN